MKRLNRFIFSATSYLLYAFPAFATHDPLHTFASQPSCILDFLARALDFIIGFVGIAALLTITLGGFRYMTSGGDKYKVEEAQGTVTAGIVGLVLALVAFLLVAAVWYFVTGQVYTPTSFLRSRAPVCP